MQMPVSDCIDALMCIWHQVRLGIPESGEGKTSVGRQPAFDGNLDTGGVITHRDDIRDSHYLIHCGYTAYISICSFEVDTEN